MKKQLLLFALFSFTISINGQNPVVAYHFHNGTYYDIAGLNFHPKVQDDVSPTADPFGNPNSAARMQGGYLDIGDADELEFINGAITITDWIFAESADDWTALVNK